MWMSAHSILRFHLLCYIARYQWHSTNEHRICERILGDCAIFISKMFSSNTIDCNWIKVFWAILAHILGQWMWMKRSAFKNQFECHNAESLTTQRTFCTAIDKNGWEKIMELDASSISTGRESVLSQSFDVASQNVDQMMCVCVCQYIDAFMVDMWVIVDTFCTSHICFMFTHKFPLAWHSHMNKINYI